MLTFNVYFICNQIALYLRSWESRTVILELNTFQKSCWTEGMLWLTLPCLCSVTSVVILHLKTFQLIILIVTGACRLLASAFGSVVPHEQGATQYYCMSPFKSWQQSGVFSFLLMKGRTETVSVRCVSLVFQSSALVYMWSLCYQIFQEHTRYRRQWAACRTDGSCNTATEQPAGDGLLP